MRICFPVNLNLLIREKIKMGIYMGERAFKGTHTNQRMKFFYIVTILMWLLVFITSPANSQEEIFIRVAAGSDDAEESASGSVSLNSSDLELVYTGSNQTVGMRFNGVDIPQGATITDAYMQFQVDETSSIAVSLTIQGEDVDDAIVGTTGLDNSW
jgi:hypothetical protein